jgi:hypothetical protein
LIQSSARVEADVSHPSRLELWHASIFTAGFFLSVVSLIGAIPPLSVVGGLSLMLSAVLSRIGMRRTYSGVLGPILRVALGPLPLATMRARTATWILIGLALTAWGAYKLTHPAAEQPPHPVNLSAETRVVLTTECLSVRKFAWAGAHSGVYRGEPSLRNCSG